MGDAALDDMTDRLRAAADPAKKAWWERYLKGEIEFFGTPMADIRTAVHDWKGDREAGELREVAWELFRRPVAEQKLAAILILQEILLPVGEVDPERDLPQLARLFDEGHIAEWNTTDWLCVRVLGALVEQHGSPVARQLAGWVHAPGLWRRRAAAVSFVPVASRGDELFDGLVDLVLTVLGVLVADEARFAQTGVGWVLRELSDAEPRRVFEFIVENREDMSREAIRMAAARLSDGHREQLGIEGKRRRR